jgi:signal transduction histidine kinase/AmiR/NasT family two-component response regulator
MFATITCIEQHDLRLVVLAAFICFVACGASLSAYRRAALTSGGYQLAWTAVVGASLGSGVWATHFVAILAYQQRLPLGFELAETALSLLIAVGGAATGVLVAVSRPTIGRRMLGGALIGLAVAGMHFLGVHAMRLPATIGWTPAGAAAAVAIGVTAAAAAFAVAGDRVELRRGVAATLLLALAICGLHFTAMGAVILRPGPMQEGPTVYGREALALGVGGLTALILFAGGGMLAVDRWSKRAALGALHSALDRTPNAIAFFDRNERLIFWNDAYGAVLTAHGLPVREGLDFPRIVGAAQANGLPVAIAEMALSAARRNGEYEQFRSPRGRWYDTRVAPTGDGGFVIVMNDITEHRELAEREAEARRKAEAAAELESRARRLAEAASTSKTEFLANMSHEIRTPLNAVLGMVQVMERDGLSEAQRRRLEVIGSSGRALLAILNDVLDLTKIEVGKLEAEAARFDLVEAVELAAAAYAPMADQKDIAFQLNIDPAVRGWWIGDSARLRQVLTNLISNALKFTSAGSIEVAVRRSQDGVSFEVADTGIGVPKDKLEAIFEKFTQADASTTRRYGGTGLGLAICYELVRLLGGELTVASTEGEGSRFAFSLPLVQAAEGPVEAQAQAAPGPDRPIRILAAEDNPTNQLVLSALLEPVGVMLTTVGDGRQAVEAFVAGGFDLVLMDVQMPVMNGVEAAAEIRSWEALRGLARTPILALTANVMRHQIEEYLQAGMDGFVAKPIEAAKLFEAVEAALSAPTEPQAIFGHLPAASGA